MDVNLDGSVTAETFHPGMCGTNEAFESVFAERFIDDITALSGTVQLGRTTKVTQLNKASRRTVTCEFTDQGYFNSPDYGGATCTPVSGAYNKVYFAPVRNSRQLVTNASWSFKRTFG